MGREAWKCLGWGVRWCLGHGVGELRTFSPILFSPQTPLFSPASLPSPPFPPLTFLLSSLPSLYHFSLSFTSFSSISLFSPRFSLLRIILHLPVYPPHLPSSSLANLPMQLPPSHLPHLYTCWIRLWCPPRCIRTINMSKNRNHETKDYSVSIPSRMPGRG